MKFNNLLVTLLIASSCLLLLAALISNQHQEGRIKYLRERNAQLESQMQEWKEQALRCTEAIVDHNKKWKELNAGR